MKLRTWHWASGISIILIAIAIASYWIMSGPNVPQEFSEARIKGAEIAEEILAQQANTLQTLEKIAQFDKARNTAQALILISEEVIRNREANSKAIKLSSQLQRMASALTSIKPNIAQTLATQAVTSEVSLVSRLLSYNDYLSQLFEVLKDKFEGKATYTTTKIQDLINNINDEVKAINDLNKDFTYALNSFDALFIDGVAR
ncbi:MAG: hypothetical protein Q8Q37_02980 [bacterium]|nr:hypothetical protein [bacterium]